MLVTSIFSFSHNVFLLSQKDFFSFQVASLLSSENALNLNKSKILSFGKELNRAKPPTQRYRMYCWDIKMHGKSWENAVLPFTKRQNCSLIQIEMVGWLIDCIEVQLFPKRQILDSSKLKEFADDNNEFDENGRKFPNR